MRLLVIVSVLWLASARVTAQPYQGAPQRTTAARLSIEATGAVIGTLAGLGTAALLGIALGESDDGPCVEPCDDGYFQLRIEPLGMAMLWYLMFGPPMVGIGTAAAARIAGHEGRYDLAIGGAALGLTLAVAIAFGAYAAFDPGDDAPLVMFVTSGLLLPLPLAILFYELSPQRASHTHSTRWAPFIAVTRDGHSASFGVRGAF